MKLVAVLLLACLAIMTEGCGGNNQPQPGPVPPAPVPTVPAPPPTIIAIPIPLPTLPPPVPKCSVQITRANVLEVCGYVSCPAGYTSTGPINVVLESAAPTGTTTMAWIGPVVAAALPAGLAGVPGVPAGSEYRAFRFDLTAQPYQGDPRLGPGAPVTVAVPGPVANTVEARSPVVYLQDVRVLMPHIVEATADGVRGFVGVSTAVTLTSIDLQLFNLKEFKLEESGFRQTVSVTLSAASTGATTGTTMAYPDPFPGNRAFTPVWFEGKVQLEPGARVVLMASATGYRRAFSRPAIVKPGATAPGLEINFRVIAAGTQCNAPPGASFARNEFELAQMVRAIGRREVGPLARPAFPDEAVIALCLPSMPANQRVTVSAVRTAAGGLSINVSYEPAAPGATGTIRPWVMLAIPTVPVQGPLKVIEERGAVQSGV